MQLFSLPAPYPNPYSEATFLTVCGFSQARRLIAYVFVRQDIVGVEIVPSSNPELSASMVSYISANVGNSDDKILNHWRTCKLSFFRTLHKNS